MLVSGEGGAFAHRRKRWNRSRGCSYDERSKKSGRQIVATIIVDKRRNKTGFAVWAASAKIFQLAGNICLAVALAEDELTERVSLESPRAGQKLYVVAVMLQRKSIDDFRVPMRVDRVDYVRTDSCRDTH
ncbi:hypothetical protein [Rhizobium leguminosarum]|uniref:hypothetical protein n=1 Tax=Rhizobium leguminosarum TaxID=384 RepID=UPI0014418F6E|nr:hypothetical protein [Rhizobium leguminosarum]NKJ79632.1 hypothetical protein [Rhizobium leguminosarum bv. viciae]